MWPGLRVQAQRKRDALRDVSWKPRPPSWIGTANGGSMADLESEMMQEIVRHAPLSLPTGSVLGLPGPNAS